MTWCCWRAIAGQRRLKWWRPQREMRSVLISSARNMVKWCFISRSCSKVCTINDRIVFFSFPSWTVGLDIQQKFNVYYAGARSFETDNPTSMSHDSAGETPQQSAAKPHSAIKATPLQEIITSSTEQGMNSQAPGLVKMSKSNPRFIDFNVIRRRTEKRVQPPLQE